MGRKVGMTQIYDDFGNIIPVTVIFCEPSQIIDRKMVYSTLNGLLYFKWSSLL